MEVLPLNLIGTLFVDFLGMPDDVLIIIIQLLLGHLVVVHVLDKRMVQIRFSFLVEAFQLRIFQICGECGEVLCAKEAQHIFEQDQTVLQLTLL